VSSNLGGGEPLFTLILCLKLWGYLFTRLLPTAWTGILLLCGAEVSIPGRREPEIGRQTAYCGIRDAVLSKNVDFTKNYFLEKSRQLQFKAKRCFTVNEEIKNMGALLEFFMDLFWHAVTILSVRALIIM
jgi:hypothetical protein